jgi:hypothetical protein
MTEQQRPDEDVEGHQRRPNLDAEAVDEEDVGGHRHMLEEGSADDVAGHSRRGPGDEALPNDEGDDVGGHSTRAHQ